MIIPKIFEQAVSDWSDFSSEVRAEHQLQLKKSLEQAVGNVKKALERSETATADVSDDLFAGGVAALMIIPKIFEQAVSDWSDFSSELRAEHQAHVQEKLQL